MISLIVKRIKHLPSKIVKKDRLRYSHHVEYKSRKLRHWHSSNSILAIADFKSHISYQKFSKDERRANAPSYPEYKVCWSIPAIDLSVSSMQDIFKTGLSLYHCEARSALPGYQKANELTTVS